MPSDLRQELAALGERRRVVDATDQELARDIRRALGRLTRERVTKSEAARLLGVHRTTLYRVYDV